MSARDLLKLSLTHISSIMEEINQHAGLKIDHIQLHTRLSWDRLLALHHEQMFDWLECACSRLFEDHSVSFSLKAAQLSFTAASPKGNQGWRHLQPAWLTAISQRRRSLKCFHRSCWCLVNDVNSRPCLDQQRPQVSHTHTEVKEQMWLVSLSDAVDFVTQKCGVYYGLVSDVASHEANLFWQTTSLALMHVLTWFINISRCVPMELPYQTVTALPHSQSD